MTFVNSLKFSLRKIGLPLFIVTFLSIQAESWVSGKMYDILSSPEGATGWVWFFAILSILISVTVPSIHIAIVGSAIKFQQSGRKHKIIFADINQLIIELLRSYGKIMLWSFAFLLPGFVKWIRLSLVPWVVLFDPEYDKGHVDALSTSEKLSKGLFARLMGLFFLFSMLIPLLMTSFDEYKVFWQTPVMSLFLAATETLIVLVFLLWFYRLYEKKMKGLT